MFPGLAALMQCCQKGVLEINTPGFQFSLCYSLILWPWASNFISRVLLSLLWKEKKKKNSWLCVYVLQLSELPYVKHIAQCIKLPTIATVSLLCYFFFLHRFYTCLLLSKCLMHFWGLTTIHWLSFSSILIIAFSHFGYTCILL